MSPAGTFIWALDWEGAILRPEIWETRGFKDDPSGG